MSEAVEKTPAPDLNSAAAQIQGLLDDDGHYNPNPDRISRGHPDYDPDDDARNARDDRGRFAKKTADPADEETEDDIDAAAADVDESGDDPNADTDTGDTDADLAASADETPTDSEDTATDVQTLSELAQAIDIPLDQLKEKLTHSFRAADEDVTVTLAELEKGYQKDADYRRNTAKLAEERRAAETEYQQRTQQFEQSNHLLANQYQVAERLLLAELEHPRMAELRESDPAEWTARREELAQRVYSLRDARQQMASHYQQFTEENLKQVRQREQQSLMQAIPDWSDTHRDTAKKAMATLGYNDAEINQVFDHRLVKGALELAALRKEVEDLRSLKTAGETAIKRVKKDIPVLQKPGKSRTSGNTLRVKRDNLARLRTKAKKSGRVEDAALVIENLI